MGVPRQPRSRQARRKTPVQKKVSTNRRGRSTQKDKPGFVVCIGASAGGLNAVLEIVAQLDPGLNATVLIVFHLTGSSASEVIAQKIRQESSLDCTVAKDGERIKTGHIYVAPADIHLLLKEDRLIHGYGPHENRFRPSIDVLFRSVAVARREKAIGIILTGFLSDGTNGMWTIKQSGGYCIVQDPNEAEFPDMPSSVLQNMEVDHVVPLREMGTVITEIIDAGRKKGIDPPPEIIAESELSERAATGIERTDPLGEKAVYSCPDCGGALWEIKQDRLTHYRCHVGHSYSQDELQLKQVEGIEQTLWMAVRMMEERKNLLTKLSGQNSKKGLNRLSSKYKLDGQALEHHIRKLKDVLFTVAKG